MSFELSSTDLASCLSECDELVKIVRCDPLEELTLDEVLLVKEKLLQLEEILSGLVKKLPASKDPNFLGLVLCIDSFLSLFPLLCLLTNKSFRGCA